MAPKRRSKVMGSVVKTKVVQETVQVTTAIVAEDDERAQLAAAAAAAAAVPAVEELTPGVNMSSGRSTVVHVEVTTPDGDTSADVDVKRTRKRGRDGSKEAAAAQGGDDDLQDTPTPPLAEEEEAPVSLQSQETQDPNEHEAEEAEEEDEDASKKKVRHDETDEEQAPETPKVASERKTTNAAVDEQGAAAGTTTKKKPQRRRRRLGGATAGGDEGAGGMGGYKRYVWRVLKQVHPDLGASGGTMQVLDMMLADMFERLAGEAARLAKISGKVTLTSREVQTAVRLVLPGELGKHAISEGVKAISKYMAA